MKKHLADISPSTSTILLHLKKIDQIEYKKLAENDFQYLAILSLDIDFLVHFKKEYEQICTNTKIFCFSKTTFFEDWIGSNKVDKLVIDYDFSTNVFASGLVYLKYFLKQNSKNKALTPLQKYNRYFLIASQYDIAKERSSSQPQHTHHRKASEQK